MSPDESHLAVLLNKAFRGMPKDDPDIGTWEYLADAIQNKGWVDPEAARLREAVAWGIGYLRGVLDEAEDIERADNPYLVEGDQ